MKLINSQKLIRDVMKRRDLNMGVKSLISEVISYQPTVYADKAVEQMNNRYLFKAKRVDNGEWVKWNIFTGLYGMNIDKSTICQCIGLKDKNGKLAYENDIVRCGNKLTVKVNKEFARWWLKGDIAEYIYRCCKESCREDEIEIIGNIFDMQ